jgi:hypothetical protein
MTFILIVLLVVLAAAGAFGVALAVSSKRKYTAQNEIVPGQKSGAPASWAGDNSPEAKLHRRLGDLVRGIRSTEMPDDVRLLDARVGIEQQAVHCDQYLIAVAALPVGESRTKKIEEVGLTVEAIIEAAAEVMGAMPPALASGVDADQITQEVEAARVRMQALVASEPAAQQAPPADVARYTF